MASGDEELRAQVRAARKRLKLTQEDVAGKVGLSLRTYQSFESGGSWPQKANLRAILQALDLNGDRADVESAGAEWSADVRVFLDTIAVYLEQLTDAERHRFMREETRRIFAQMRTADAAGVDPQVYDAIRRNSRLGNSLARDLSTGTDQAKQG